MKLHFDFNQLLEENLALELFSEIELEFCGGEEVKEYDFDQFVLKKKQGLVVIFDRLTETEKHLILDKWVKDLSGDFTGFREYWITQKCNQIDFELLVSKYPIFNEKKISYDNEELMLFEERNTLYKYFNRAILELTTFFEKLNPPKSIKQGDLTHKEKSELSAFEIALKHWYLVKANIEDYIIPKHVGEKYKDLANYKNIETSFGDLDTKPRRREPTLKNLNKVKKSLIDFPEIQKAIENDIDKLC
jgi:hypothetical protein|uniref:hypothetical protein n=1 Tax=Gelidibacter sp. TaxID=2018083 RepID=UPI004049716E